MREHVKGVLLRLQHRRRHKPINSTCESMFRWQPMPGWVPMRRLLGPVILCSLLIAQIAAAQPASEPLVGHRREELRSLVARWRPSSPIVLVYDNWPFGGASDRAFATAVVGIDTGASSYFLAGRSHGGTTYYGHDGVTRQTDERGDPIENDHRSPRFPVISLYVPSAELEAALALNKELEIQPLPEGRSLITGHAFGGDFFLRAEELSPAVPTTAEPMSWTVDSQGRVMEVVQAGRTRRYMYGSESPTVFPIAIERIGIDVNRRRSGGTGQPSSSNYPSFESAVRMAKEVGAFRQFVPPVAPTSGGSIKNASGTAGEHSSTSGALNGRWTLVTVFGVCLSSIAGWLAIAKHKKRKVRANDKRHARPD